MKKPYECVCDSILFLAFRVFSISRSMLAARGGASVAPHHKVALRCWSEGATVETSPGSGQPKIFFFLAPTTPYLRVLALDCVTSLRHKHKPFGMFIP